MNFQELKEIALANPGFISPLDTMPADATVPKRDTPSDLVLGKDEYVCRKCSGTGYQLGVTEWGFLHFTDICTNCRGIGKVKIVGGSH